MKHSIIAGMLITAALSASPVFATDEDLCDSNIQKLQDAINTAPATSENAMDNVKVALKKAQEAKAAGNTKDCIEITSGTLTKIQTRTPDKG